LFHLPYLRTISDVQVNNLFILSAEIEHESRLAFFDRRSFRLRKRQQGTCPTTLDSGIKWMTTFRRRCLLFEETLGSDASVVDCRNGKTTTISSGR